MVGWRSTKLLMGPADRIITPAAMITAAIMIASWSTMPTAVMTESSEKTTSSRSICTMTLANEGMTRAETRPSTPSSFW